MSGVDGARQGQARPSRQGQATLLGGPAPRRWGLALGLSLLVHLTLVALALGMGVQRFSGPVDIELTGMRVDAVKDLPLGAPAGKRSGKGPAPRPAHHRRSPPAADGTLASGQRSRAQPGQATPIEDPDAPAPTGDLSAYGPKGSRLTVLLRLDRLRGTPFVGPVDALLARLPDRRDLLDGTGLDLFQAFDALLIATPHPLDPSVTFLAARHHLTDTQLRAAMNRGAKATGRAISWRVVGGRLVGERRARHSPPAGAPPSRDDRLIVLAAPGLAVVTPPAYRALLMSPHGWATGPDGGVPDGGVPDGGGGPDAGTRAIDWTTMLWRIGAEEGLIPPDGVAMVSAVDIFKTNAKAGVPPVLYGMEVPSTVSAVIGLDDGGVFVDVEGQFLDDEAPRHWETAWPELVHKLSVNPLVLLGGFSPLVSQATLSRDGQTIRLHVTASADDAQRLLALGLRFLGG